MFKCTFCPHSSKRLYDLKKHVTQRHPEVEVADGKFYIKENEGIKEIIRDMLFHPSRS